MGKRSEFKRRENDAYFTPRKGALPLLPFLHPNTKFVEPCGGDFRLASWLEEAGHLCLASYDIEPKNPRVHTRNALTLTENNIPAETEMFITNPPWTRELLHPIIERLRHIKPTWLLFDADWAFTDQAVPYLAFCSDIIPVGRLRWVEDSKHDGKDNCAWYRFQAEPCDTILHPRPKIPRQKRTSKPKKESVDEG